MKINHHESAEGSAFEITIPRGEKEAREVVGAIVSALRIYQERSTERRGVWRQSGIKGQTFQLFSKAERAFRQAFANVVPNPDHYRDAIIYAAFALVLSTPSEELPPTEREALDGTWPWPWS